MVFNSEVKEKFATLGKDFLTTAILAILALIAVSSAGFVVFESSVREEGAQAVIDEIKNRDVLDFTVSDSNGTAMVTYSYRGEPLPEKLAPDEVVERRTETSWARIVGVENKGTPQEKLVIEGTFYSQPVFVERDGAWYYIEYGSVPKTHWEETHAVSLLSRIFLNVAYAASISPFASSGDGYTSCDSGGTWDLAHNWDGASTDCTLNGRSTNVSRVGVQTYNLKGTDLFNIYRGYFPFDTSSIPASGTVTAATLNIYATSTKVNTDQDTEDYLTVVQTSQSSTSSLADTDFDQCGAIDNPTEGIDASEREDFPNITLNSYVVFTLNSTGMGWIKKSGQSSNCGGGTGITCLGVREGHDTSDLSVLAPDKGNYVDFETVEATGTSRDPYLSITYTAPSFAFWQFQDF